MANAILSDSPIWTWGLLIIALTIALHVTGVVSMALVGVRLRAWAQNRHMSPGQARVMVIGVVISTSLLLAVLHAIEVTIWALAYLWLGAFDSPFDAMLYSADGFTTHGASGLTPQRPWLMMASLEAADGMLLFGISTAYVFAVMQSYWPLLSTPTQTKAP